MMTKNGLTDAQKAQALQFLATKKPEMFHENYLELPYGWLSEMFTDSEIEDLSVKVNAAVNPLSSSGG